jgi:DNA primase small subunit
MECWPLMTIAIKILDASLRDDFGFNHILWVYSGRRGVHCWVCDSRARKLNNEQRAAIADYFRVYKVVFLYS